MPWKEVTVVEARQEFVTAYRDGHWSLTALCRAYGISRKTGYKFLARYAAGGIPALTDRSRAPHRQANAIAPDVVARLLAERRRHPGWGPRKLLAYLLRREPFGAWPAASSVSALFRRHGVAHARRRRWRAVPLGTPLVDATEPNAVWTADFKGWFHARNGQRCDPLTIADAHTRYLFACQLVRKADVPSVWAVFERAFRQHGLPEALRTDNGPPFASTGLGGLTRLSVRCAKLGIVLQRGRPGCPQDNGRHERVHLTLQQAVIQPPRSTRAAQQRACAAFVREYNHERPHAALGNRTPADLYTPSPRPYPRRLEPFVYPPSYETRWVNSRGTIRWRGAHLFLSEILAGETVGLRPASADHWAVHFGPLELALIDDQRLAVIRYKKVRYVLASPAEVSPMCPG